MEAGSSFTESIQGSLEILLKRIKFLNHVKYHNMKIAEGLKLLLPAAILPCVGLMTVIFRSRFPQQTLNSVPVKSVPLQSASISSIHGWGQFSHKGTIFAVSSQASFRAWDATTGISIANWTVRNLEKSDMAPDGENVAIITGLRGRRGVDTPYSVEIRDLRSGQLNQTLIPRGAVNAGIYSLAWSADSQFVAIGSGDGLVRIWNVSARHRSASLPARGWMGGLQFSPDGKYLVVAEKALGGKAIVKVWNWRRTKLLGSIPFAAYPSETICRFSPDGQQLAIADIRGGQVLLVDAPDVQAPQEVVEGVRSEPGYEFADTLVAFSPSGKELGLFTGGELSIQVGGARRTIRSYGSGRARSGIVVALQIVAEGRLRWVSAQNGSTPMINTSYLIKGPSLPVIATSHPKF